MIKAFVFGKFLPFHKGHEAMIRFALTRAEHVTVLICCSDKEKISPSVRKDWISHTFKDELRVEVKTYCYKEVELPNSSVSSREISAIWSEVFTKELPGCSILVTSEPYGEYVAEYMGIRHIPFDFERTQYPIAASAIANNLFAHWNYLPDAVKPFFAKKVVILGTESTGKSTLTKNLVEHFNCTAVDEAGRDLIADSNHFEFSDLEKVATEHAKRIKEATKANHPLLIIDTDIHITKSYAQFVFEKELLVSEDVYQTNKADLYLYLDKEVPYYQDGTRLHEAERNAIDASHRKILNQHQINFVEIGGGWQERFEKAVAAVNDLIMQYKKEGE